MGNGLIRLISKQDAEKRDLSQKTTCFACVSLEDNCFDPLSDSYTAADL